MSASEFIATFEGCRLDAYADVVGVWTIGYGHTLNVQEGDVVTQDEADLLLSHDVDSFTAIINHQVQVPLNQNQKDALTSLCYNIGSNNFQRSTLLALLNRSDYVGAAHEFTRWCHAGGREIDGLLHRRIDEQQLFNTPVAEVVSPVVKTAVVVTDNTDGSDQHA